MTIRHRNGEYNVEFGPLAESLAELPHDCVIVTDATVYAIYGPRLPGRPIVVPAGEASKSTGRWAGIQSELAALNADRSTVIVAFGGGVVGDLAGFVAATYMRGVPLIQFPTSLLAQVDSSVGGKVGIDIPEGKNLVGAFYPPIRVFVCDETLDTLPERELRNGMAEVWKYGFIMDSRLVGDLRDRSIGRPEVVSRCIAHKAAVVEADERETTGRRAILNFGHTVGHAIEKITGYGPILHGEAISIGMVAETALAESLGLAERGTRKVVEDCLQSEGLPTTSVVLRSSDMLIEAMRRDKKATAGRLAFSLLTSIGGCTLVEDVPESEVRAVLSEL